MHTIDANVLVDLVVRRKGYRACLDKLNDVTQKVVMLCSLVETLNGCEEEATLVTFNISQIRTSHAKKLGLVRNLNSEVMKKLKQQLENDYDSSSPLLKLFRSAMSRPAERIEYAAFLRSIIAWLESTPDEIDLVVEQHGLQTYPRHSADQSCVPNSQRNSVKTFIRYVIEYNPRKYLEEYIERFALQSHFAEVRTVLKINWDRLRHDGNLLATYSKAREEWPPLRILTRNVHLKWAEQEAPSHFCIELIPFAHEE